MQLTKNHKQNAWPQHSPPTTEPNFFLIYIFIYKNIYLKKAHQQARLSIDIVPSNNGQKYHFFYAHPPPQKKVLCRPNRDEKNHKITDSL